MAVIGATLLSRSIVVFTVWDQGTADMTNMKQLVNCDHEDIFNYVFCKLIV